MSPAPAASVPSRTGDTDGGRPLAILHVTPHFVPSYAGLTTVVRFLGRWELARGHEVHVAAFFPWADRYAFSWWGQTATASERFEGLGVERFIQREIGLPRWLRPVARRRLGAELEARLAGRRLDIIHVAGISGLTFAAARLARRRRIPMVLSLYGEEFERFERPVAGRLDALRRRVALGRMKALFRQCAAVTASGRHLGEMAVRLGLREDAAFIPNGACVELLLPPSTEEKASLRKTRDLPQDRPVVLCIQGLAGRKGSHNLLDAFSRVAARRPDALLVVVGGGPDLEPLKARALAEGFASSVRFLGFQSHEVCQDLYRACDLYLQLPLREEGVSQTAIEAQAAGKPVVLGRCPAMEDSVAEGEGGFLVDSRDPGAASAAVLSLLDDPALRQRMGERGRAWVLPRFSYEAITDRYLEVFRAAVESPRG